MTIVGPDSSNWFQEYLHLKACPDPLPEGWSFTPLDRPQPIRDQTWPSGTRPWVSILTVTYHHASFIEEALESFLMQETTFPVEIIVHDDASKDRTAEILCRYRERYPNLFHLILQEENQFSQGRKGLPLIYQKGRGFYVALCEGDDYWLNPQKLEIQSRVLGHHRDAVVCGHKSNALREGKMSSAYSIQKYSDRVSIFDQKEIFMDAAFPMTQTLFFRKLPIGFSKAYASIIAGDRYVMCQLASEGKTVFIPEVMAVYRVHPGGMFSMVDPLKQFRSVLDSYRVIIAEIPPKWGSASAVVMAKISIEGLRSAVHSRNSVAIKDALKNYLWALICTLRGLRQGLNALPVVLMALARVLLLPWNYLLAKLMFPFRNREDIHPQSGG